MSGWSIEGQTVVSYTDDVDSEVRSATSIDNELVRADRLQSLVSGDLRLAWQHVAGAPAHEQPQLMGICASTEARVQLAVYDAYCRFASLPEYKPRIQHAIVRAAECLSQAIEQDPRPVYHYNLGLVLTMLDRKAEAARMFQLAADSDDTDIAIKARKELGRLGPIREQAMAQAPQAAPGGPAFVPRKKTNWPVATKGIVAVAIGIPLLAVPVIGLVVLGLGAFWLHKGFVVGLET